MSLNNQDISIGKLSRLKIWITDNHLSDDQWSNTKKFIIIKITTEDGIEGWGEAFSINFREKGIAIIIKELFREISNIPNLSIKSFYNKISLLSDGHRGLDFSSATSAIEIALWDISGKLKNLPLNSLLTKSPKPNVPIYATCWSDLKKDTNDYLRQIEKFYGKKYGGIKIYPMLDSLSISIQFVEKVREIVGDELPLMLDLAVPEDLDQTKSFLKEVSSFNPYWIEEPVDGENISLLTEIKNTFNMKVVTGEKQSGLVHFRELISRNAADIFNPDISGMGGLIDIIEISNEASNNGIFISPHCWNSMSVSASAMLHVCSSIPNSEKAEIFPDYINFSKKFCELPFDIIDNKAHINKSAGLGIVIHEDILSELSIYSLDEKSNDEGHHHHHH
nr:Chain A, Enolase from the environmental genome shotgun sequencing of the Sargasso Sea [unidentified]2QGY_B Chain B, Enolase from the environmental genome shotgun sequencing of the Sargasso Sea [unidentified]